MFGKYALALMLGTAAVTADPVMAKNFFEQAATDVSNGGRWLDKNVIQPTKTTIETTIIETVDVGEKVVKGAVAVTGLKAIEDVLIEGKSLKQSLDETLEDGKDMVRAAARTPMLVNHTINGINVITRNVLGNVAGDAIAVVSLPSMIVSALPAALVDSVISISEDAEAVEDVVGIPLNAALKQAHQALEGRARPMPGTVFALLKGTFGEDHLSEVRYLTNKETGNIAGLINALQSQFGEAFENNHAVTIGNIIVFAEEPSHKVDDAYFWAHEVQHTVQYAKLGFDGFAGEYTRNHGALEDEADQVAQKAIDEINTLLAALGG